MFEQVNRSTATIEILIMLVVAFILGFILAWILRKNKTVVESTENNEAEINKLTSQNNTLTSQQSQLEKNLLDLKSKLTDCESAKNNIVSTVVNPEDYSSLQADFKSLKAKNAELENSVKTLQTNLSDCESSKNVIAATTVEVNEKGFSTGDAENAKKLGFKVASAHNKDDLTRIKGVGPFIEKKLNGLGIYTFEQISEFTLETVEKVTQAIEFFPGRIQRDNWVSQANDLK